MPTFSAYSERRLSTCDSQLVAVFREVIEFRDCRVLSGHRGEKEQEELFEAGATQLHYPRSRHNSSPSQAIDVVPYPIDWEDLDRFKEFVGYVLATGDQIGVKLEAGGHWKKFRDYPHFQLPSES